MNGMTWGRGAGPRERVRYRATSIPTSVKQESTHVVRVHTGGKPSVEGEGG